MAPSHPGFLRASHEDQTSHEDPCLRLLISHSARTEDDQRASPAGRHLALLHRTRAARAHPTALMWGKQGVGSGQVYGPRYAKEPTITSMMVVSFFLSPTFVSPTRAPRAADMKHQTSDALVPPAKRQCNPTPDGSSPVGNPETRDRHLRPCDANQAGDNQNTARQHRGSFISDILSEDMKRPCLSSCTLLPKV